MFKSNARVLKSTVFAVIITLLLFTGTTGMAGYYDVITNANPIAYWRLGETSGTTAFDETVNARNGTYAGTLTLGQPGALPHDLNKAVDFSAGQVTVPDGGATLGSGTNISVEMWITADSLPDYSSPLMKSTSSSWANGYGFFMEGGQLKFFAGLYAATFASAPFGTTNGYRQVVGVFEGFNSIRIYLDGVLQQSVAQGGTLTTSGTGNLYIGNGAGAGNTPGAFNWDGKIDEVSIYSYALSDSQVQAHYLAAIVPEPSSVVLLAVGGMLTFRRKWKS